MGTGGTAVDHRWPSMGSTGDHRWTTGGHRKKCGDHRSGPPVELRWTTGGHRWVAIGCQFGSDFANFFDLQNVTLLFKTVVHGIYTFLNDLLST